MSTIEDPPFVAETLAWCNEERAKQGKPALDQMPMGDRNEPLSCPCGEATGLHVDTTWFKRLPNKKRLELPGAVHDFVVEFDRGRLPQYDKDPHGDNDDDEGDWFE